MTTPARELVLLEYSGGRNGETNERDVATITMNNPDRRNALDNDMFVALENALADVQKHSTIRVVVLRANGPAFCAGFNLHAVANDASSAQPVLAGYLHRLHHCIDMVSQLPAITIAAVSGAALAGGCALVSTCDFVIATADAKFGYPTHAIGLSPALSGPTLSSRMGLGAARELLLGGELISGARAFELGFASHMVASEPEPKNPTSNTPNHNGALVQETSKLTHALLAKGPRALLATKRWLQQLDPLSHHTHRASALAASMSGVGGGESVDRVAAVWKKRS
ncbi:MAG: enoyl-CoA hydratase/isomerase family protein [Phycisphaerales bacterium]|nr:enoyl-CoA hydratase/isomerase family protein [Phycisphaerales bacterium]